MVDEGRSLCSQKARHGPAMPEPMIRTFRGVDWVVIFVYGTYAKREESEVSCVGITVLH